MNRTRSMRSSLRTSSAFFREFLRAPSMIGSIVPTSRLTVRATLDQVRWDACRLFVEYGPGMGTFTHEILARLSPAARLIAIDTNDRFIDHLAATIDDPRFHAVHGSAAQVGQITAAHGHDHADFVLSGLPFSTLAPGVAGAIMTATHGALRPGGAFLIYQYSRFVLPLLRNRFQRIDERLVWRNVPPCRIFAAWKGVPDAG